MGACCGREGAWYAHHLGPHQCFREEDAVSWRVTSREWTEIWLRTNHMQGARTSVEQCYNEDDLLRSEFSMQGDIGQQVIGRSVYVADGFVSYGDIFVPNAQWETCEGTWFRKTAGSQRGQEVRIKAVNNGGLVCVLTGRWQSQHELHWVGAGKPHRLADTFANVAASTPATTSATIGQSVSALCLWRRNPDGHAELNVAEGDADSEEWQPCDLRFHDGLARFTVVCKPKGRSRPVLTYERQVQDALHRGRFRGVDLVFDSGVDKVWPLLCGENVRDISLHMANVDEKRRLLQLVFSLGIHAPAALTVPVPHEHLPEVQQRVARWQRHVQPLQSHFSAGQPQAVAADFELGAVDMVIWFIVDVMLAVATSATVLVSAAVLQETGQVGGEAGIGFENVGFPDNAMPSLLFGVGDSGTAMLSM